jgi:hypothetical protein
MGTDRPSEEIVWRSTNVYWISICVDPEAPATTSKEATDAHAHLLTWLPVMESIVWTRAWVSVLQTLLMESVRAVPERKWRKSRSKNVVVLKGAPPGEMSAEHVPTLEHPRSKLCVSVTSTKPLTSVNSSQMCARTESVWTLQIVSDVCATRDSNWQ